MLISMGLAKPHRSWYYALITTLFSVLGGIFGYIIGYYGMEIIAPWIAASSLNASYHQVESWFITHGVLVIFIAGFSPIPYKLFTIAAGALNMAFLPFVLASFLGRGLRFFLVSTVMYFMGERLQTKLRQYVDIVGWAVLALLLIVLVIYKVR